MHVYAGDAQARQGGGFAIDGAGPGDRNAEFVFGFPGRDLVMGARVHIRVHPDRDWSGDAPGLRDGGDGVQLGLGFHVEAEDLFIQPQRDLPRCLANARESDALPRHASGAGAAQFAFGDHIHAGAQLRERLQHRLIGIGFHGEADQRVQVRKGVGEDLVVSAQRRGRIAIERRLDTVCDQGKGYILRMEDAVAIGEMMHGLRSIREAGRG